MLPIPDKEVRLRGRWDAFFLGLVQTFFPQDLYGLFIQASTLPLVIQERNGTCWTLNTK